MNGCSNNESSSTILLVMLYLESFDAEMFEILLIVNIYE